jgi:gamma-glutamyltranspeptidase/glutathione hydrolase
MSLSDMRLACAVLVAIALSACSTSDGLSSRLPVQPESASGFTSKSGWQTARFAVAAANPLAANAGYQILKAGGSALDAAVAVQMVLALVEPQSSGLGGGAFLMHFDGKTVQAFDGRETAPAAAHENLFIKPDGKPMAFFDAVVGGRAVGVPGMLRMLEMAHREHGVLPWAMLFAPAIRLAEQGFSVSHRLNTMLAADKYLKKDPAAADYFYDQIGKPWPVGHLLKNPQLAAVLREIATHGSSALYEGAVAQAIVDKVRTHPTNPGLMTTADLAAYKPLKRDALCHAFGRPPGRIYKLCGFPPPSSGALAIGQIFGIFEQTSGASIPLTDQGLPGADWLHHYTEAARLAFADRAQYVADPAFVSAPGGSWLSLLSPDYLRQRAALIGEKSMRLAKPGQPAPLLSRYAPMPEQPEYGTSHISIIDSRGRAVAMTTTIEAAFGSRQMVQGFLLNNQLTDFSFKPRDAQGRPIANRVEAGKRPRSSMSPTLVFDQASGALLMSAGSPGGALIIHYTAKTLWGTLVWGLNIQQAINLANFGSTNGPTLLEKSQFSAKTLEALKARGHDVRQIEMTSGLQAIARVPGGFFGGADPRREGIVMGD